MELKVFLENNGFRDLEDLQLFYNRFVDVLSRYCIDSLEGLEEDLQELYNRRQKDYKERIE